MTQQIDSLLSAQGMGDDTAQLYSTVQNMIKSVRTMIEAEVIEVKENSGVPFYKVKPLLQRITPNNEAKAAATIPNVPAALLNYGNFAFLGKYKVGAKVVVGIVDHDHTNIKLDWKENVPASFAFHDFSGAIILYGLWASGDKFDNVIDTRADGELKIITTAKINVETKEANIKATKATVEADTVNIDSGDINLGKGVKSGVLTAGTLTLASSDVNISGIGAATLTGELVINPTSGSKQVKAGA